jgi:hypothetical protein
VDIRRVSTITLLEIGAALFGSLLLAALVVLIGSRIAGGLTRARHRKEPAPSPGEVPPSRHVGISHVAAR